MIPSTVQSYSLRIEIILARVSYQGPFDPHGKEGHLKSFNFY